MHLEVKVPSSPVAGRIESRLSEPNFFERRKVVAASKEEQTYAACAGGPGQRLQCNDPRARTHFRCCQPRVQPTNLIACVDAFPTWTRASKLQRRAREHQPAPTPARLGRKTIGQDPPAQNRCLTQVPMPGLLRVLVLLVGPRACDQHQLTQGVLVGRDAHNGQRHLDLA